MGTLTLLNMVTPLRASTSATSCGVETITAPGVSAAASTLTVDDDELAKGELHVARPGRHVDDEHVQVLLPRSPVDVEQKLLHSLLHHEAAPRHRRVAPRQEVPDAHGGDAVVLQRQQLVVWGQRGRAATHRRSAPARRRPPGP